jgi:N-sulfoglucosamine sulfohydrolase
MPTILDALGLSSVQNLDGRSFLPLLSGKKQSDRNYVFTTYYQIFGNARYPMRCVQNRQFGYIFNFWSDGEYSISGDATGGLTWKAMINAAKDDPAIAKRVELFKHRVPEEFYDFKNDPDALKNLINDPAYAKEIQKFRDKMLESMSNCNDPAYETYRNRNNTDAIKEFMIQQKIKATQTKPDAKF